MWGSNDEVGAVTIDLNTLGEQSFTVRDGSGEAAPTWSERISGPGVAGTFNFRLLVTTDPNPATSVGVCLRGSPQHMVGRRCGDASSLRAMAASAAISHVAPGPAPLLGGALVAVAALVVDQAQLIARGITSYEARCLRRSGKPLPLANGQEKDRIYDGKLLTVVR